MILEKGLSKLCSFSSVESSDLAPGNSDHFRLTAHVTLGVAHLWSYLSITWQVSLPLSLCDNRRYPTTPSLPTPPESPNAPAAATALIYKLWEISTVLSTDTMLFDTVRRCQPQAPSLQLTRLYTCCALQQTYLTFNSNYTFKVTKPQSLGILAQFFLQKQSRTWDTCRAALSLRFHFTWEKELTWDQDPVF